jgi:hypothetical protein
MRIVPGSTPPWPALGPALHPTSLPRPETHPLPAEIGTAGEEQLGRGPGRARIPDEGEDLLGVRDRDFVRGVGPRA